jgi:hypothetical protein
MDEIERRLKAGGMTAAQRKELWESLYLRTLEIPVLLAYAKEHATHPWIFPMICMAAHTGARRSELTRMLVTHVDFDAGSVTIREKKRVRGKDSTRRAPLTTVLKEALQAWLAVHPGGNTLFCHAGPVERSRKRSRTTGHQSGTGRAKTLAERLAAVRTALDRIGGCVPQRAPGSDRRPRLSKAGEAPPSPPTWGDSRAGSHSFLHLRQSTRTSPLYQVCARLFVVDPLCHRVPPAPDHSAGPASCHCRRLTAPAVDVAGCPPVRRGWRALPRRSATRRGSPTGAVLPRGSRRGAAP